MGKKKELRKEDILKKLEELKGAMGKLGREGKELSKNLETELLRGQRLVKSLWDTMVLKKKLDKGFKDIGKAAHKMISCGQIKNPRLSRMAKDLDSITRLIKRREREAKALKKGMRLEFKR